MKITICSLFPEYFSSPLACSMLARAQKFGKLTVDCVNYRNFTQSPDQRVDDRPYGGGRGMILQPQVLARTVRSIDTSTNAHRIYLSASGQPLTAHRAKELSLFEHLILICGHYEGIDQRAIDLFVDEEISMGDFVLTSGCPAALSLIDAVIRHIPGVLGHPDSVKFESFESGLLEAPQYTRPLVFEEKCVPDILLSGDHQKIAAWRRDSSIEKTKSQRPDLFLHNQNTVHTPYLRKAHNEGSNRPFSASWTVDSLEKNQKWFGEIWPFQVKSISNRSISITIDNFVFELMEQRYNDQKSSGLNLLSIDLSQSLSRRIWQHAQTIECEMIEMKALDQKNKTLFAGQVNTVDPQGIKWQWNCSF